VELSCKVVVATEPTGLCPILWVGELDLLGKLQAERTAISERDNDRNLNDFNVAFMIIMKLPWTGVKENQDYDRYDHDQDHKPCRSSVDRKHSRLDFLCLHTRLLNWLWFTLCSESEPLDTLIL